MGGAVTIILMKERQVAEAFLRAGADSPEGAVFPSDLAVDLGELGARRLVKQAVLRETADGRYYLDGPGWDALRSRRRRLAFAVIAAIALAALVLATTATGLL